MEYLTASKFFVLILIATGIGHLSEHESEGIGCHFVITIKGEFHPITCHEGTEGGVEV
jgi:hypothetical protein